MVCEKCQVCLGRVPGEDFSYSDHMGVHATFQIRKNITGKYHPVYLINQWELLAPIIWICGNWRNNDSQSTGWPRHKENREFGYQFFQAGKA